MSYHDYRRIAREKLANNWWLSIGIAAVAWLLGGLLIGSGFLPEVNYEASQEELSLINIANGSVKFALSAASAFGLAQFILGGTIQLGYAKYLLAQHDGNELNFNDLFSQFNNFGTGFAQKFLRSLYCFLWGLLFIIPGIVASYKYAMTPYILAENPEMTASQAMEQSKYMMDGHKGELFTLNLTFIGWNILAAITLNLGHLALNPYKNAARTVFYRDLQEQLRVRHNAGYM